jgi:hypothetical protein
MSETYPRELLQIPQAPHVVLQLDRNLITPETDSDEGEELLWDQVLAALPDGEMKQAFLQRPGYRFRAFKRRSDDSLSAMIDGELHQESTYSQTMANIQTIGIESSGRYSQNNISRDQIFYTYLFPRKEELDAGIDTSFLLLYKDDEKLSLKGALRGVLEVRWK